VLRQKYGAPGVGARRRLPQIALYRDACERVEPWPDIGLEPAPLS
jgi:hypothetical protein